MNITNQCTKNLKMILLSEKNENVDGSFPYDILQEFLTGIADVRLCFFPGYPALPETKYLLFNYNNLRPELKIKIAKEISKRWHLVCSDYLQHKSPEEKGSSEPVVKIKKNVPETVSEKSDFLPDIDATGKTFQKNEDIFDRFLGFIALLVKGFSF